MEVRLAEAWKVGSEAYGEEEGEQVRTFVYIMHTTCIDQSSRPNLTGPDPTVKEASNRAQGSTVYPPRNQASRQTIHPRSHFLFNLPNPNNLAITQRPYS